MQDWHRATVMWDGGGYSDMPYMVRLPSGHIFATLTISPTGEGQGNTKCVGLRSEDDGLTWSALGDIAPAPNHVLAWAVPWVAGGRLYVATLFNQPATHAIPYYSSKLLYKRADIHGRIRLAYSENDGGSWQVVGWASWNSTAIDVRNAFAGVQKLFWLCGMPRVSGDHVFIPISKMGRVVPGNEYGDTESFILKAPAAPDYFGTDGVWPSIPASGTGIQAQPLSGLLNRVGVRPQEEPSIVLLDGETIYGVFRTTLGRVGDFSVKTDGSGLAVEWARQADSDTVYNPRAKAELFDFGSGRYLLWHHAMGGTGFDKPSRARADVRVGTRQGDRLIWSKPSGIAYNTQTQMLSYPSAILSADGEEIIFAATDKATARCWRMPVSDFF